MENGGQSLNKDLKICLNPLFLTLLTILLPRDDVRKLFSPSKPLSVEGGKKKRWNHNFNGVKKNRFTGEEPVKSFDTLWFTGVWGGAGGEERGEERRGKISKTIHKTTYLYQFDSW